MSKKKTNKKNTTDTYKGKIDISRSGIGYVIVEGLPKDILVRPTDFNSAFNGDTVLVEVTATKNNGRTEGRVTEVLERKQTEFIGHVQLSTNHAFFVPDSDKPIPDFYVPQNKLNGAVDRDRVVVKMTEWKKGDRKPVGEVVAILNAEDVNDMAMKEIVLENGFSLQFDAEVMEEAALLTDVISAAEVKNRKDFRSTLTFTIDPVDAKDFDDALSFKVLKDGLYEIGVHIADVSHFVQPDTALDKSAYDRATSVYLPDRVLPMLPEHISNVLCSLRPHEDKCTFSAVFEITDKGEIKKHWIGKTVIHSDHRFAYEDVQSIIETGEGPYKEEVLLLNTLAQKFRKKRFKSGAINFSSVEVRFQLDEKGKPIGIVVKESKEAHQLIEEFMLLANKTVAEFVAAIKVNDQPVPFPYRIHDTPDEDKLKPFTEFARKYGHKFDMSSPEKIAASFNQMLKDAEGQPEKHVLEQLGIRTMAKAVYATENIGHYGLGFEYYCHFTSPIRRYPDVLVHRIVESCLQEAYIIDKKMDQKCRHTSERERAAMDSERSANKYKQVEYMQQFLGDDFDGVVSGVASFGFWVETVDTKCEGLVSLNSLLDYDEFRHVEEDYCLVGVRSAKTFRMGDKVTIKVVAANLEKRQLDYHWVVEGDYVPPVRRQGSGDMAYGRPGSSGRPSGGSRPGGGNRGGGHGGGNRHKDGKPVGDKRNGDRRNEGKRGDGRNGGGGDQRNKDRNRDNRGDRPNRDRPAGERPLGEGAVEGQLLAGANDGPVIESGAHAPVAREQRKPNGEPEAGGGRSDKPAREKPVRAERGGDAADRRAGDGPIGDQPGGASVVSEAGADMPVKKKSGAKRSGAKKPSGAEGADVAAPADGGARGESIGGDVLNSRKGKIKE